MQHVPRCCRERQSDGTEYKKTLRRPELRPADPAQGAYSAPANPRNGEEGLTAPSPRTPSPLSALRVSPLLPRTPKLVPTPLPPATWSEESDYHAIIGRVKGPPCVRPCKSPRVPICLYLGT